MRTSKFIVLEGIDGSGKSTQLRLLKEYCDARDLKTATIHFPRLDIPPFGPLIAGFLKGEFGELASVHPKLVALLYAEDRRDFADTLRVWLDDGMIVIADRYVNSNIAFQCAKCSDHREQEALKQWILSLEYTYFNIPRPDISIYLDLTPEMATQAMDRDHLRASRDYLDGGSDIHESDQDFQDRVRNTYLDLVRTDSHFELLPCRDALGNRLTPEQVHENIISLLNKADIF